MDARDSHCHCLLWEIGRHSLQTTWHCLLVLLSVILQKPDIWYYWDRELFIEYRIKHCRNYQRRAPIVNLKQNLNEKKYSHRAKAVPKIFLLFIKRISPCWSSLLGFSSSTILFSPMALFADGLCFFFVLKCVNYNRNITRRVHINVVIDLREGNSFLPRGSITM